LGCCYQQTQALGVPACFHSTAAADLEEACDPSLGNTEDCGWLGIDEDTCRSQGCCYGPPEPRGAPRCFRSLHGRALLASGAEGAIPPKCVMPDAHRVDCGFDGITPKECVAKDCCYFHGLPGFPFCYFKVDKAPAEAVAKAEQCEELDEERIDCGYDGVEQKSCEGRGCCYRHAATPGAPFCYYKRKQAPVGSVKGKASQQCVMSDADRVDCGYHGMTPDECRAKGCCYFHSHSPGSPFCYYQAKGGSTSRASEDRCSVPGKERKDCGFGGISAPQCRDSGCCYAHPDVAGAPFCFYKAAPTPSPGTQPTSTGRTTTPAGSRAGSVAAEGGGRSEAHEPSTFVTDAPEAIIADAPSTTASPDARLQSSSTSRIQSDVMASNHFRGAGTESQDRADSQRQTVMTLLAAAAISSVVVAALCLRSPPASEASPEEHVPLNIGSPRGSKSKQLEPGSDLYREFEKQFVQKWDTRTWPTSAGRVVPPPRIEAIFEIDAENRMPAYKAKQREIDSLPGAKIADTPGNETIEFHGARLRCSFQGVPCHDKKCAVCRVVESGSFGCERMGGEIHFRDGSHAAKGQGLAPGRIPPPESLDDFVSHSLAGNAVFVANVLLGTPQIVSERTKGPLPPGTHSRIAEKAYGVDEIVIFDEAQAVPRALILFG